MLTGFLKKVFGSKNERDIKRIMPIVERVGSFESKMKAMRDDEFPILTNGFKETLAAGKEIDEILPEAFAAVREAAWRKLHMRHFDVQLIGGIVLHEGKIAEMKTGEGKTLVATLPVYLNALAGKGAHLVTVNDYLAKRDSRWMGAVYHFVGLSVGVIQHDASFLYDPHYLPEDQTLIHLRPCTRREAYHADVTYGTNNEYGFDYLRDNMKFSLEECVQREPHFAIVDEVDSILIDEARTPLIISGQTEESTDKYYLIDRIMPGLKKDDHYTVDEKARQVLLNDEGVEKVEDLLKCGNLYDPENIETLHHVNQALRAHALYHRDVDYVVKDGQVVIVDEFTGRLMPGRRWSDGLHQAVEAKERVKIENENQTLATVTFQNYFRMYEKLSGMTGTADTEAAEFNSIYNLEVIVIPTNKPLRRGDNTDLVYKTKKEKFKAVLEEIKDWNHKGRPVLVGTISIEDSEKLAAILKHSGVRHHVLNAKQHEREAEIVAQAGRLGAVTISTNMAGRGTDILLGGNPEFIAAEEAGKDDSTKEYQDALREAQAVCEDEKKRVLDLGGLHIIGTERHESRRIDNQLRGRAGRQGDPGSSRFYLSLEDDLMRIFGSDRIASIMDRIGMEEGVPIEHGLVSRAIENAQKKVEAHNFDIRKHLLEYDDVMNQQREVVYGYRRQILAQAGLRDMVKEFSNEVALEITASYIEEKAPPDEWDVKMVSEAVHKQFGIEPFEAAPSGVNGREELAEWVGAEGFRLYGDKVASVGEEVFNQFEKIIMLHTLDGLWKDHLLSMDHLKGGIGLRGYGQKDPLQEYKKEGYNMFVEMIARFKAEVVERLFRVQIKRDEEAGQVSATAPPPAPRPRKVVETRGEAPASAPDDDEEKGHTVVRHGDKIGRNDPCPCGSGKKHKKCCGAGKE
ncbi:MAG: preprotein translocase subunit SecA [Deltaproteobacteria bacterium]|nr:preprotein translocase subunit SecA [Deltaproteobacteria bacterium]